MKLLFLANRMPYPPYRGDKLKIYNLAKRLCKEHELHLLTFTETGADKQYIAELRKVFKKVETVHLHKWRSGWNCIKAVFSGVPLQIAYFHSEEIQQKVNELVSGEHYDGIHVQHLRMAPYLQHRKDLPCILDLPDAFSLYWLRRQQINKNLFRNVFEKMEQKRLEKFETIIHNYKLVLVCSQEDLEYLEKLHGATNLRLLSNGVDTTIFQAQQHDYSHNNTLLFTGNMDYAPNVDAVTYFTEEIFPDIRNQFSQVTFIIAGQRPLDKVKSLANDHIEVTGFVKDLAEVYDKASIVVAPLRFGAGTQNKVLEAMAMSIPVVCSHVGFKGLGIENGEGTFMAADKETFIKQVCNLLASEELRKTTGEKGRAVVNQRFDWDVIAKQLEGYFKDVQQL